MSEDYNQNLQQLEERMEHSEIEAVVARLLQACAGNEMLVFCDEDTKAGAAQGAATSDQIARASRMRIFDEPLVGVAHADDPLFERFKQPDVIGPDYQGPQEWLKGARSVVSVFFPFSDCVRKSNQPDGEASLEWQYAKYFGTKVIGEVCHGLCSALERHGWRALMPSGTAGFGFKMVESELEGQPDLRPVVAWSERHAAFASGLGTFGISKGLITRRGMAGRFGSIVTDAPLAVTPREYEDPYEWCSHCGACVRRCPVRAITMQGTKNNKLCQRWCLGVNDVYHLGDACGKCQVRVPCERSRPR